MNGPDSIALPADPASPDATTAAPDETDLLVAAGIRFEWYRDGFRVLLGLLLIGALLLAVSLGLNVFLLAYQPPPRYFVQTADHQLVGVVPLDEPSFSDERVTQ